MKREDTVSKYARRVEVWNLWWLDSAPESVPNYFCLAVRPLRALKKPHFMGLVKLSKMFK